MLEREQGRKACEEMEARYQNQIAKLTQSLQQQDIEKMKREEEGKEREKELESLREEMERLKRENEELKEEMGEKEKKMKEEIDERKDTLDQMNVEKEENDELKGKMEELNQIKQENESLKGELNEMKQENESMKGELDNMKQENESLKGELDNMKQENESMKEELNEIKQENESMKGELDNMKQENESLKEELNEIKQENESLNGELDKEDSVREREELSRFTEEFERIKQENESLKEELEKSQDGIAMSEAAKLKEELDKLNKVNLSLREEIIRLDTERRNAINPLDSSQLSKGYQIEMNELHDHPLMESQDLKESEFRNHPPDQFFYSSPLPHSSSSLEAYRLVISQLYREVLSLQRENQSLSAQLDAAEPLRITISPSAMEESNAGMKSLIASMQMTMQTLQITLKEKNDLIAKLNAQLQQLLSNSSPLEEFSSEHHEEHTENVQLSEEQTESNSEEEQEMEKKEEEQEEQVSPEEDFSQEMQAAREEAERLRQSCEQLMEENQTKEKLLEEQRSRELQLTDELSSLQKQVVALERKRDELQSLLSLSRQNIQQLSKLFKGQLGQLRKSFSSLTPLIAMHQSSLQKEIETTVRTVAAKYAFLTNHLLSSRQLISSLRDELQNYKGNYRVMIRVRPINSTDTSTRSCIRITDEYNISIQSEDTRTEPKSFVFDRVLPPAASQEELFLEIEPAVLSVFRGINSTVLAYGQTGSGKTYSMVGEKGRLGIAFRSCRLLFEEFRYRSDTSYELKVRFIESIQCRLAFARFIAKHCAICSARDVKSTSPSLQKIVWLRSLSSPFLPLDNCPIDR